MSETRNPEIQDVLMSIYKKMPYLNPALRRIAAYILEYPNQCKNIGIKELAIACNVAESSVTRFVKEIGFTNYQQMKIAIVEALSLVDTSGVNENVNYVYEDVSRMDSMETILDKVLRRNIQTLTETKLRLNIDELNKAVGVLEKSQTIIFCCIGSSSIAAEEALIRFIRAGKKCVLNRDESLQLMTAGTANSDDVVIGLSNSGRSKSVNKCLMLAKENGAATIGITSFEDSPLAKNSDITLLTSTKTFHSDDACYWESTTSKSAQIFTMDVLYACYAARNFDATLDSLDKTYKAVKNTRED